MTERPTKLSSRDVAGVLKPVGIDEYFLERMVHNKAVHPSREPFRSGGPMVWGPEDIFKAFVCKIKQDEFSEKYPNSTPVKGTDFLRYLSRYLATLKFTDLSVYTSMEDWRKITLEARKRGIDFDKTPYAYVPPKG